MLKTVEVTGKTEDEAVASALAELGLSRDEVSVEVIERAKSGFLGIKSAPALVRVSYEVVESRSERIERFLSGLLGRMDIEADIDISESAEAVDITLSGKEPGALIGRRGETLDAIQHLTNYVINRGESERVRVNIDAEGYRIRRNETLESLAQRTAAKVLKYRRNITLDPMNAYERHVIHAALQDNENISTYSVGSEPGRRIVVAYKRGDAGQGQQSGTDFAGSQNRRFREWS